MTTSIVSIAHLKINVHGVHQKIYAPQYLMVFPKNVEVWYLNHLVPITIFPVCIEYVCLNSHDLHLYVIDNVIVGNLIVRPDPTFGGGAVNFTGNFQNSILHEFNYNRDWID